MGWFCVPPPLQMLHCSSFLLSPPKLNTYFSPQTLTRKSCCGGDQREADVIADKKKGAIATRELFT